MASSSTYAFFQFAVEFPHCSLQHLSWGTTNFLLDSLFQFIQCPWPSRVDPILKVAPQEKITNGQIWWSWGPGNVTESWDDIVNEKFSHSCIDCLAVCDVAPSCWNQASWSCGKLFSAGATKDCSISTYAFQKLPFFVLSCINNKNTFVVIDGFFSIYSIL